MQIRDKEQERKNYENSPQGKRKNLISKLIVGVMAVVFLGVVYVMNHNPAYVGTPHEVTVDGFTIIPGETTGAQLYEAGFQISDKSMYSMQLTPEGKPVGYTGYYSLDTEVEKRTYYYGINLIKNGESYAMLEMINTAPSNKTVGDMKVKTITVVGKKKDVASLEGIPTNELTKEALIEKAGEPESETPTTGDDGEVRTELHWEKGNYEMEVTLNQDGTCESFQSSWDKQ